MFLPRGIVPVVVRLEPVRRQVGLLNKLIEALLWKKNQCPSGYPTDWFFFLIRRLYVGYPLNIRRMFAGRLIGFPPWWWLWGSWSSVCFPSLPMCSVVEDLSLFLMVMLKIKDIIMKILYLFSITNNTNIITIHICRDG